MDIEEFMSHMTE